MVFVIDTILIGLILFCAIWEFVIVTKFLKSVNFQISADYCWLFLASICTIMVMLLLLFCHLLPLNSGMVKTLVVMFYALMYCYGTLYFMKYVEIFLDSRARKIYTLFMIIIISCTVLFSCYISMYYRDSLLTIHCSCKHINYYHLISAHYNHLFIYYFLLPVVSSIFIVYVSIHHKKYFNFNILMSITNYVISTFLFITLMEISNNYLFTCMLIFLLLGNIFLMRDLQEDRKRLW